MVQIIPPKTNVGTQIGQATGQGLQAGLHQGFQRGQLQNALKRVEDLGKNSPEGKQPTPFELASALMSATAGIPGAERYVGQLFPLLLAQLQNKEFGGIPPAEGAAPATAAQPANQQAGPAPQAAPSYDQILQKRSALPLPIPEADYNPFEGATEGIELGQGPIPKTHSEQQYSQVAQAYRAKGLDPGIALEQMQLEDQVARQRQQDVVRGLETEYQAQTLRAQAQDRFRGQLRQALPNLNDADFSVAEQIAQQPHLRAIKNDKLRADQTRKEYNLYEAAKENFRRNSVRRDYDNQEHKRQLNNLASYAKEMVKFGQRDQAERILAENDWGPTEIESILTPLPESLQKGIKALPKLPDLQTQITVLPDDPKFDQQVQKAMEKRRGNIEKYGDFIANNFQTGQYDPQNVIKPGTSLLQLRDEALQQGMSYQEFEGLINSLVARDEIELDSYQRKDLPLLAEHPIKSFGIGEILWRLNPWYIPRK
jgi:hypothetical protein